MCECVYVKRECEEREIYVCFLGLLGLLCLTKLKHNWQTSPSLMFMVVEGKAWFTLDTETLFGTYVNQSCCSHQTWSTVPARALFRHLLYFFFVSCDWSSSTVQEVLLKKTNLWYNLRMKHFRIKYLFKQNEFLLKRQSCRMILWGFGQSSYFEGLHVPFALCINFLLFNVDLTVYLPQLTV